MLFKALFWHYMVSLMSIDMVQIFQVLEVEVQAQLGARVQRVYCKSRYVTRSDSHAGVTYK